MRITKCRCTAEIIFLQTVNGKAMPVNAESIADHSQSPAPIFNAEEGHVSHYATCPYSAQFRKPRKKKEAAV